MYSNAQAALLAATQLKAQLTSAAMRVTSVDCSNKVSGREVVELADFFKEWLDSHDPEPGPNFFGTDLP